MPQAAFLGTLGGLVLERVLTILGAPLANPEMIWFVVPLVAVTLIMTLYFGLHPKEELGWNTALGNYVVLLFISIDMTRYIYQTTVPPSFGNYLLRPAESLIVAGVGLVALLLMLANFFHFLPQRVAFFISAFLPVNLMAYVVMAIVYADVPVGDGITILAAIVLFFVLLGLLTFVQVLERAFVKRIMQARGEEKKGAEENKATEGANNPGDRIDGEKEKPG